MLRSKVFVDVEPFLVDGVIRARDFANTISAIHTNVVDVAIDIMPPNRVLNTNPPLIDPSEAALPRATRATLAVPLWSLREVAIFSTSSRPF